MYDPINNWCDWPNRVQCGERPICDEHDGNCKNPHSTAPKTSTPAPQPSTPMPDPDIPGKLARNLCTR